ncbi:hypothetical protein [Candidatus Poriferisodalis sp.]|uniref:hypothetical protein n=1 Tax=Candidatus Poriferisodalis sp. TaxID=3101277 RepID=UPI003D1514D0
MPPSLTWRTYRLQSRPEVPVEDDDSVTVTAGTVTRTVAVGVDCAVPSDPCDDPLGSLAEGVTARSGTITADASCTSAQRRVPIARRVYYARRHTFTLDAPATVTVDMGSTSSIASRLDTDLLLLGGHNAGAGTVEGRNDNVGGGHGTDYRNSRSGSSAASTKRIPSPGIWRSIRACGLRRRSTTRAWACGRSTTPGCIRT